MNHTTYKVSVSGLNLHKAIDFFDSKKIHLTELERINQKQIIFNISKNDYLKFQKEKLSKNYKIKILARYGIESIVKKVFSKVGLFLGIVIMGLTTINLTSKIHSVTHNNKNHICQNYDQCIYSKENITKVNKILANHGIEVDKKISQISSSKKIKNILMQEFPQISDVSINIKGTNISIDILEAKLPTNNITKNLVATENGIVIQTEVSSGILKVKNGDIVMKGDTLIEYNGTPVSGNITLRTFYNESTIFNENQVYFTPTKNKMHFNEISLFKLSIKNKINCKYSYYRVEKRHQYLSLNSLLPIKIKQTTFYELKKIEIYQPFETKKQAIYSSLETQIKQKIPPNSQIKNTSFTVKKEGSRYLINCYIETYLSLKI